MLRDRDSLRARLRTSRGIVRGISRQRMSVRVRRISQTDLRRHSRITGRSRINRRIGLQPRNRITGPRITGQPLHNRTVRSQINRRIGRQPRSPITGRRQSRIGQRQRSRTALKRIVRQRSRIVRLRRSRIIVLKLHGRHRRANLLRGRRLLRLSGHSSMQLRRQRRSRRLLRNSSQLSRKLLRKRRSRKRRNRREYSAESEPFEHPEFSSGCFFCSVARPGVAALSKRRRQRHQDPEQRQDQNQSQRQRTGVSALHNQNPAQSDSVEGVRSPSG